MNRRRVMAYCNSNGVRLCYEVFEPTQGRKAPALLLIMGLGAQMIAWPDALCQDLAGRGWRVIRYDNRDAGLSQQLDELGVPNLESLMLRLATGTPVLPPYELGDMARDALGLLDALAVRRAHVVGASMGSMVAQIMAATHPERLLSLGLMMTTSGNARLPRPSTAVMAATMARPKDSNDHAALHAWYCSYFRTLEGFGYRSSDAELQAYVDASLARAYRPAGTARQTAAILAADDRSELLRLIEVPTQIIHGDEDPLTHLDCGKDVARKIPGAKLVVMQGMGHALPTPLLPKIAELIHDHATAAADRDQGEVPPSTTNKAPVQ